MVKNKNFNILFIARSNSTDQSAYTQRLQMLAKGLQTNGIKTDFLYLGDRKITSRTMLPIYFPFINRMMRKYDFVHAGGPSCGFVANLCKIFTGTKVISDIHGDRIGEICQNIEGSFFKNQFYILFMFKTIIHEIVTMYFSDYFLTSSAPLKTLIKNRGIPESKIFVVRSGVETKLFQAKERMNNRRLVITYAGQFQTYQAVDDLVDACVKLMNSKVRLQIIGFTENDRSQKETIKYKLKGNVDLIDRLTQDKLVRHLQESDILVIPRKRSRVTAVALPTKFAEYLALGKPVVVADVDETSNFIKKYDCGFIYSPSVDGLAEVIQKIINMPKRKLQEMGKRGRKLAVDFFDWSIVCQNYYQIIRNHLYKK